MFLRRPDSIRAARSDYAKILRRLILSESIVSWPLSNISKLTCNFSPCCSVARLVEDCHIDIELLEKKVNGEFVIDNALCRRSHRTLFIGLSSRVAAIIFRTT